MAKKSKNPIATTLDRGGLIPTCHRFDFDKVKTIDDIKLLLEVSQLIVYDNYEGFNDIKHLLADVIEDE